MTPLRLEGRVAVVTGSTKGIGYEVARTFLAHGARVAINSRTPADVASAVHRLRPPAGPDRVFGAPGDVASYAACQRIVTDTVREFGGLDVVVNNAGVSMVAPSLELSPADWERTIATDLSGPFYLSQAGARAMIVRGGGSIINVSSILGLAGLPKRAAYCSSKHGLIGLTKVLASEWAHLGIRVNSIAPGYIRTDMDTRDSAVGDYDESDIVGRTPLARYGTSEEVANVALFLASDESSYVTGANITVDGGWTPYAGWPRLLDQLKEAPGSSGGRRIPW